MKTIKRGNSGDEVKSLQSRLNELGGYGLSVDGEFGPKTETAVKDFQKRNNLSVDGIVGPKTWTALGLPEFSEASKCIDPSVIYKPLPVHVTKYARTPQYLAIHFTGSSNSTPGRALREYDTFITRNASADFVVDDRDIVQFNPDLANYYCWAVGEAKNKYSSGGSLNGKATNKNTVSIEICSSCTPATTSAVNTANHEGWSFTDKALDNAVKLARIIMKEFNIPIERVVRHYDITGKLCPGIIGWNDETIYKIDGSKTKEASNSDKWLAFKERLRDKE